MQYLSAQIGGVMAIDAARTALVTQGGVWSWGDVRAISASLNALLDTWGLPPGAPIGLLLRTRPASAAAVAACIAGGRTIVTLNPMLPDRRLCDDIARLSLAAIAAERADLERPGLLEAAERAGVPVIVLPARPGDAAALHAASAERPRAAAPATPETAVVMLTSGTTGEPKRVPLGYRQLEIQLKRAARADPSRSDDDPPQLRDAVSIHHAPLVHISGMWALLGNLAGGLTTHLIEKFNVPEWRDAILRYRPATSGGPPAVLRMIFDADLPKEDLASLRALGTGTAGVDPALVDAFLEKYNLPVLATYGATEFGGGVAGWSLPNFRKYWATKRGASGRLNPGCEARIVDPDSGAILPPGETGVLELRATVIGDGKNWVRTSDRARLDEDHFIWIDGRVDNAILRGGFKIRPEEVEQVLRTHPAVAEVAVVGLEDARLGSVPAAAIELRPGVPAPSAASLEALVRGALPSYCVPVNFAFVANLPRTPSMKVSMPLVREIFSAEQFARRIT